jgi:hypothetical protein
MAVMIRYLLGHIWWFPEHLVDELQLGIGVGVSLGQALHQNLADVSLRWNREDGIKNLVLLGNKKVASIMKNDLGYPPEMRFRKIVSRRNI